MAIAKCHWPLIDANISDQLPKLYLFDSVNRTTCGGDMSMSPIQIIAITVLGWVANPQS